MNDQAIRASEYQTRQRHNSIRTIKHLFRVRVAQKPLITQQPTRSSIHFDSAHTAHTHVFAYYTSFNAGNGKKLPCHDPD